jgi:Ca2+-binding RTX toxin-like protein
MLPSESLDALPSNAVGCPANTLVGGPGFNRFDAGAGNDVINARNGRAELVSCGSGRDRARVDRSDRVRNCERVQRSH